MLSHAYRKDSIPQQGRETAALRDFKSASAETRGGARPVPASALQNRMVGFPGTGRTELAELAEFKGITKLRTAAALH